MCIFNHGSLDDIIHNGNYPSVWASMELAVQDSNVSFGSVIDSNLFSLSIYEIKKCILFQLQVLFPVVNALILLFWDHTETSH